MSSCSIRLWRGKEALTTAQIDYVLEKLRAWGITAADEVDYSPQYGNICVRYPTMFDTLIITDGGNRAFNYWQVDGFVCEMGLDTKYEPGAQAPPARRNPLRSCRQ